MCIYILYVCVYIPHTYLIGTTWSTSGHPNSVLVAEPSSNMDKARHPDTASLSTRAASKVNSDLPSGCRLTAATSVFQHRNLLLSQSHRLKQQMLLHHGCS